MAMLRRDYKRHEFADGTMVPYTIQPQHFLHRLRLKAVKGTFVGGSSPAWVAGAGNKLIANIAVELTLKGSGQIVKDNLSFEDLRRLNLLQYKDTPAAEGYAYLDFHRLPVHALANVDLKLTWGTLASLTTGSPTGTTGTYLYLRALEEVNEGQPVGGMPLYLRKTHVLQANSVGEVKHDLNTGNIVQAVLVVPSSATLIQSVSVLQDGIKQHITPETWADLREENKADFELDAVQADFGVLNFDLFGEGSQAIRTDGMDTLELIFATAAEASQTIRIVVIERVPTPAAA